MRFSQRKGLSSVRTELQRESMDDALRNGLWSAYVDAWAKPDRPLTKTAIWWRLFKGLWCDLMKSPVDEVPLDTRNADRLLRDWFYRVEWFTVYDFVEHLLQFRAQEGDCGTGERYSGLVNQALEKELSAYRVAGTQLVEIADENELAEIEEALETGRGDAFGAAREHLSQAARLVFDRKGPDYRNSIKESISAVEATAKIITDDEKATVGVALQALQGEGLHPSLVKGFRALYSWTSDAEGIRHALKEEPNCGFHDAKYMLVACAAFVNYLVGKMAR